MSDSQAELNYIPVCRCSDILPYSLETWEVWRDLIHPKRLSGFHGYYMNMVPGHRYRQTTHPHKVIKFETLICWAGEMAQQLRALAALPEVLSSILHSHIHGGSQPSVMESDALFWCA
jgi:proteasome lid subunit RPN8/RPN11